jgi:hypothetical protein
LPPAAIPVVRRGPERKVHSAAEESPELLRKVQVELDPARLIATLRAGVRSGNLRRNAYRALVYVRPDFCWFIFPDAFAEAARDQGIPYTMKLGSRFLESLARIPQVVPRNKSKVCLHARAHPDAAQPKAFVRVQTMGFLSKEDLGRLGTWPYEIVPCEEEAMRRIAPRADERGGAP